MRRGAILAVPNEWLLNCTKFTQTKTLGLLDVVGHHQLLKAYGCSEESLQWLTTWHEDNARQVMLYCFTSEEQTRLPVWALGTGAMFLMVEELNERCRDTKRLSGRWDIIESKKQGHIISVGRARRISLV